MKSYRVGQRLQFRSDDFDKVWTELCTVTEVHHDYCIAVSDDEITFYIDEDTEFQFQEVTR